MALRIVSNAPVKGLTTRVCSRQFKLPIMVGDPVTARVSLQALVSCCPDLPPTGSLTSSRAKGRLPPSA
jgi:hypothetical protein